MQTPEEFLGALEMAYADANRDRDACPSGTRIIINRGAQAAAALIRARDAEVRAEARAETLAGFTEEWGNTFDDYRFDEQVVVYTGTREQVEGIAAKGAGYLAARRLVGPWRRVEP